jgi:hypothetical protein
MYGRRARQGFWRAVEPPKELLPLGYRRRIEFEFPRVRSWWSSSSLSLDV